MVCDGGLLFSYRFPSFLCRVTFHAIHVSTAQLYGLPFSVGGGCVQGRLRPRNAARVAIQIGRRLMFPSLAIRREFRLISILNLIGKGNCRFRAHLILPINVLFVGNLRLAIAELTPNNGRASSREFSLVT